MNAGTHSINVREVVQSGSLRPSVEIHRADRSMVAIIDTLIRDAHDARASDIHISPREKDVRIRLRIDGVLHDRFVCQKNMHHEIISRIKVLSGLRTDEHQSAQDGRFRAHLEDGSTLDVRVSIAPTYHGENAVLRLLHNRSKTFTLETLGFSRTDIETIFKALKRPFGMILSTGPTGSGKTTSLYTMIDMLLSPEVSIVTIEDPIESEIAGITQIQANTRTGLTFSTGLRSMLRQDPDIIMVGEIRDTETASIAVNTALTGHLLLSTLHTNDAATTLPRLLDMRVDPYLVASTVNIAVGQRLVRRVCELCKEMYTPGEHERTSVRMTLGYDIPKGTEFARAIGCEHCGGVGYHGRLVLSEVLVVDRKIQDAILRKESSASIRQLAISAGMTPLAEDGIQKVCKGVTTLSEVLRTLHE